MNRHLRHLEQGIPVALPTDEEGFTGRQCPNPECQGYFLIKFGTGLPGDDVPCRCPYCGYTADHDEFLTAQQEKHIESIALREIEKALTGVFKDLGCDISRHSKGGFIQLRLEYKGHPRSVHYYVEPALETTVVCEQCTLQYKIFGVFAFCPDCGIHNSLQTLKRNLSIVEKMLETAKQSDDKEFADYLIQSALNQSVAAFDGFGRETCRIHAAKATEPAKADNISFQNLSRANDRVYQLFGFQISHHLNADDWVFTIRCFEKRHLLAHKMGVIDQSYIEHTGDLDVILGRKIRCSVDEVERLIQSLAALGNYLVTSLLA